MGVEPGHGDARRAAKLGAEPGIGDPHGLFQQLRGERGSHLAQRDMDRGGHHPQLIAGEHHHHPALAREMGEILGMAGKAEARAVLQGLLVDRVGGEGGGLARLHQRHALGDGCHHVRRVHRVGHARPPWCAEVARQNRQATDHGGGGLGRVGDGHHRRALGQMRRVADQEEVQFVLQRGPGQRRDLRADPGGLAR